MAYLLPEWRAWSLPPRNFREQFYAKLGVNSGVRQVKFSISQEMKVV